MTARPGAQRKIPAQAAENPFRWWGENLLFSSLCNAFTRGINWNKLALTLRSCGQQLGILLTDAAFAVSYTEHQKRMLKQLVCVVAFSILVLLCLRWNFTRSCTYTCLRDRRSLYLTVSAAFLEVEPPFTQLKSPIAFIAISSLALTRKLAAILRSIDVAKEQKNLSVRSLLELLFLSGNFAREQPLMFVRKTSICRQSVYFGDPGLSCNQSQT